MAATDFSIADMNKVHDLSNSICSVQNCMLAFRMQWRPGFDEVFDAGLGQMESESADARHFV